MKKQTALMGLGMAVVLFAGIQAVPVERSNPPVEQDIPAPAAVKAILRASCYDCHSNETVWPWYSRVAPVSWLVAGDAEKGREQLNFSTWNQYAPEQQAENIASAMEQIQKGEMPRWPYTLMHPAARMTSEKRAALEAWAATLVP